MLRKTIFKLLRRNTTLRAYSTTVSKTRKFTENGPGLREFLVAGKNLPKICQLSADDSYLNSVDFHGDNRKVSNVQLKCTFLFPYQSGKDLHLIKITS